MSVKTIPVKISNRESSAEVEYSDRSPWWIVVKTETGSFSAENKNDLFDALIDIRKELSRMGIVLLCNGAREDVFPSPASRSMAGGQMAYKLELGVPASRKNLLNIFDPAPIGLVTSPEQQRIYYSRWLESLV